MTKQLNKLTQLLSAWEEIIQSTKMGEITMLCHFTLLSIDVHACAYHWPALELRGLKNNTYIKSTENRQVRILTLYPITYSVRKMSKYKNG